MPAYLIADIAQIYAESTYSTYRARVSPTIEAAGGQYLVRGGSIDVLEGDWQPNRIVVVQFKSVAAARQWWNSESYEELRQMRQASTRTNMIIVEGLHQAGL